MGCRVNGPGETDDADLGLCAPNFVNLKRGPETIEFGYDEVGILRQEVDRIIAAEQMAPQ